MFLFGFLDEYQISKSMSGNKILMSSLVLHGWDSENTKKRLENTLFLQFNMQKYDDSHDVQSCQNTVVGNAVIHGRQFTQVTWAEDLYRPLPEIMQHLTYWSILAKENIYVKAVLDNGLWDNRFINVHTGKHFTIDIP